jgi:uncharacterized membrane protein
MKHVLAVLALWLVAIVATIVIVRDAGTLTTLGPVYAVCAIGSVVTVRHAVARRE